jgi:GDP-D-mannose dehydratase
MKILVTGAAGFIGYHIARALLERGHEVVDIDNINSYYDVKLKYARLHETGILEKEIKPYQYIQSSLFRFCRLYNKKSRVETTGTKIPTGPFEKSARNTYKGKRYKSRLRCSCL